MHAPKAGLFYGVGNAACLNEAIEECREGGEEDRNAHAYRTLADVLVGLEYELVEQGVAEDPPFESEKGVAATGICAAGVTVGQEEASSEANGESESQEGDPHSDGSCSGVAAGGPSQRQDKCDNSKNGSCQ